MLPREAKEWTIRIHVPEDFLGFSIHELVAVGGAVDSITTPTPGRTILEGVVPAWAYDLLVMEILDYVGSDEASFERIERKTSDGEL